MGVFLLIFGIGGGVLVLTLFAIGQPIAAVGLMVFGTIAGRIIVAGIKPTQKLDNSPEKNNINPVPQNESVTGTLSIYHKNITSPRGRITLVLIIDGEMRGEFDSKPTEITLGTGNHKIQAKVVLKSDGSYQSKLIGKMLETALKPMILTSSVVEVNVHKNKCTQVICSKEEDANGKAILIFSMKEPENEIADEKIGIPSQELRPIIKPCPMCAEDVKIAAKICRFCQHKFE